MDDLKQRHINSQGDEVRIHDDAAIDALPHGRLFREIAQKRARRNGNYGGSFREIESQIWIWYLEKKAEGTLSDDTHGGYVRVAVENRFIDEHRKKGQIPVEKRTTRTQKPHKPTQVQLDTIEDEEGDIMSAIENLSEEVNLSNGAGLEYLSEPVPLAGGTYRSRRSRARKSARKNVEKNMHERCEPALVHSRRHGRVMRLPYVLGPDDDGEPIFYDPDQIHEPANNTIDVNAISG